MANLEKIKNVEILRFLFTLVVVACHLQLGVIDKFYDQIPLYDKMHDSITYSSVSVEFFFIISGFFLFTASNLEQTFIQFAKNKLIRFLPIIWFSLLLHFICSLFLPLQFSFFENIFTVLNIQNVGFTFKNGDIPASWYISSLFWGMSFYFYLNKCVTKNIFNFITACIVFFSYSFWLHTIIVPNYQNVAIVFNIGIGRALAGLGLGYFVSMWFKENILNNAKVSTSKLKMVLCSLLEVYFFCSLFYYSCFHNPNYDNPMIFIIYFVCLFMLFLQRKGLLSKVLENNFSELLGKYSFSIFITHQLIINLWSNTVCETQREWIFANPVLNIVVLYIAIILFGILIHYLFEKPITTYLQNKLL